MQDNLSKHYPTSNIRITREDNGELLWEVHNTITNTIKWLFSRMMANVNPTDTNPPYPLGHEPLYGVWGLAIGSGSPTWAPETQPQETPTQTALVQEVLRKPLSNISFVQPDNNGGWTPVNTLSTYVSFQCTLNSSTDTNLAGVGIRELGLIGGGSVSQSTNMQTALYFSGNVSDYPNVAAATNTVILETYKTLSPLLIPNSVSVVIQWVLSF